jgi:uncharacterized membrane protein
VRANPRKSACVAAPLAAALAVSQMPLQGAATATSIGSAQQMGMGIFKFMIAVAATLIAGYVAGHEWKYAYDHTTYGRAGVIAFLALAVALIGAIHVVTAWNEMRHQRDGRLEVARALKLARLCREFSQEYGREPTPEEIQLISDNLSQFSG